METKDKGVTLIALVITIIVLLILAGVAIGASLNSDSVFDRANQAKIGWSEEVATEQEQLSNLTGLLAKAAGIKMTLKMNNEDEGTEVTLTPDNCADYYGKIAVNYTPTATTMTYIIPNTSELSPTPTPLVKRYTVSNTYRLFWIDWENKYGDGVGTIYLKADSVSNSYNICENTNNVLDGAEETTKMRQLNPGLYKDPNTNEELTPPEYTNNAMKAARWITDTAVWSELTIGLDDAILKNVNYVVGSPSVEMFIDSYNAHYHLNETEPVQGDREDDAERTTLFYTYPFVYNSSCIGYGLGPGPSDSYLTGTGKNTLVADYGTEDMYCPTDKVYWLASPSSTNSDMLISVHGESPRCLGRSYVTGYGGRSFSPMVSLKPDVQL